MPKLYDAWFGPEHELATQMRDAIARAAEAGVTQMELQWPVVPNLEEIAAGTLLNFQFGKLVAADLGMDSKERYPLIRRYLAQFCNLYWTKQVAVATPFAQRRVWALSGDSVNKKLAEPRLRNVCLGSLRGRSVQTEARDVVVVADPRYTDTWIKGAKLKPEDGFVLFLNSQFSETYALTGPRNGAMKGTQVVYLLKRVTRGYVFFSYPGPWMAYLEKPDLSVELLKTYDVEPKLKDVAKIVREESNRRYGGLNNDRYVKGFGGRL